MLFLSLVVGCRFSAPRRLYTVTPRGAATHTIYRTALHRSPFPNQVFFYFRTNSHSLLTQGNSSFDGAARKLVEGDAQDDDLGPERPGLGRAAGGSGETLSQNGERGLDRLSAELLGRPVGDDASPASFAVGVVLVDFDTDTRVFAQHRGLAALGRDGDDGAVLVGVDERNDVGRAAGVAAEARDPLSAEKLVDLIRGELACDPSARGGNGHGRERRPY